MNDDEDDDEDASEPRLKETLSDDSLVEYLEADPAFLGDEQLLIIGRDILTDIGDIIDLLAIDGSGIVHVIFLPHGVADTATLEQVIPQGAWVNELDAQGLRSILAGYRDDVTLDELFGSMLGRAVPDDVNHRQILTVVAGSFDAGVFEVLEELSDRGDGAIRAISFLEWDDGERVIVQTQRLL
jgi:hypothetical protein